jgi:hypothetical protein
MGSYAFEMMEKTEEIWRHPLSAVILVSEVSRQGDFLRRDRLSSSASETFSDKICQFAEI